MKLLTFVHNGCEQVGVLSQNGQGVIPLGKLGYAFADMNDLVANSTPSQLSQIAQKADQCQDMAVLLQDVQKRPAIPHPKQDVLCLGINYMDHAEESARFKAEAFGGERPYAVYFSKRVSEAAGDGETIPNYQEIEPNIDYEAELGVIIGKDAKNVAKENAKDYIFGYTIINDMSARTLQTRHKQWYFGKSLDKYCCIC